VPDTTPLDTTPITIHVSEVQLSMTMIWDAAGTAWILPAYTFGDGTVEDGSYTVLAVADEFLDIPVPVAVPLPEPMPATTDDGTSSGPVATTTVDPVASIPDMTPIDQAAVEAALVGLGEDDASAAATANGWGMRVSERDGVSLPVTADYSPTRANVAVTDGVVTAVLSIG
jgi:hypothetical protein